MAAMSSSTRSGRVRTTATRLRVVPDPILWRVPPTVASPPRASLAGILNLLV